MNCRALFSIIRQINNKALMWIMSENNSSEELENAQKNQKKIGAAENDPSTTEPADKLREEAAETVDEDEDSSEPA